MGTSLFLLLDKSDDDVQPRYRDRYLGEIFDSQHLFLMNVPVTGRFMRPVTLCDTPFVLSIFKITFNFFLCKETACNVVSVMQSERG